MEIKNRVINGSDNLFSRYGIKSITMDDIAVSLGISKKTIYQHFKDKNELVLNVIQVHMKKEKEDLDQISKDSSNAIEEIYLVSQYLKAMLLKTNPTILFDLKKYHLKAYDYFQSHKHECIENSIVRNIKLGIKEGNYRTGFDPKIMARSRMVSLESTFNLVDYPSDEFDFVDVQLQLFRHFVMGLVTPEGEELFIKYERNN